MTAELEIESKTHGYVTCVEVILADGSRCFYPKAELTSRPAEVVAVYVAGRPDIFEPVRRLPARFEPSKFTGGKRSAADEYIDRQAACGCRCRSAKASRCAAARGAAAGSLCNCRCHDVNEASTGWRDTYESWKAKGLCINACDSLFPFLCMGRRSATKGHCICSCHEVNR